MKPILFLTVICLSTSFGSQSFAANSSFKLSPETTANFFKADEFLTRLGYRNYTDLAKKTLATEKNIHEVSKAVLEKNISLHYSLTASKYLANLTYAFLVANRSLPVEVAAENERLILEMATQQLMFFPLLSLEPVKTPEYLAAKGKKALELRADFLANRAVQRNTEEKENLMKAFTYLYKRLEKGPEKSASHFQQWIAPFVTAALQDPYTLVEGQQNRHLGRAMAAVIVKQSREQGNARLEGNLKKYLASADVILDDVINARYRPLTGIPNQPSFQLKNGDIALEFSNGRDAYFTAMGVRPGTPENERLAKKYDLINSYSYMPLFFAQQYYVDAVARERSNYILNAEQNKIMADFWNPKISKGYSHSGFVQVKKDSETGISLAWVIDIFPLAGLGRVRMMSPEGFAYPENHIRVGFARYSPEKVLATFKKQIAARGFMDSVLESAASYLAPNKVRNNRVEPFSSERRFHWPATTPRNVVEGWAKNVTQAQADRWYQEEVLPKVFSRIEEFVYSKDALAFATNMVNSEAQAYCSQLVRIAFLQAANFDIAPISDVYRDLPVAVAKYFPKHANEVNLKDHFVSPNGLVWQADILEEHVAFDFERSRPQRQTMSNDLVERYVNYLQRNPGVAATKLHVDFEPIPTSEVFIGDDSTF